MLDVAIMRYDIVLAPEAVEDLENLKANVRAAVRDGIEQHLRHKPTKVSKSLREFSHPQYRLRVGDDIRVFYDVTEKAVEIVAIIPKSEADSWLAKHGESDETSISV